VAAPERRRDAERRRAVADAVPEQRVGRVAEAEFRRAAVLAMAAGEIFLESDAVAFLDAPALRRRGSDALDDTDVLVAEDERPLGLRVVEEVRPVRAAHTRRLDPQQPALGRQLGQLELAHLGAFALEC